MRFDATYNIFGIYEHQDGAVLVFVCVTKCFVLIANTDGSPLHSADELIIVVVSVLIVISIFSRLFDCVLVC